MWKKWTDYFLLHLPGWSHHRDVILIVRNHQQCRHRDVIRLEELKREDLDVIKNKLNHVKNPKIIKRANKKESRGGNIRKQKENVVIKNKIDSNLFFNSIYNQHGDSRAFRKPAIKNGRIPR